MEHENTNDVRNEIPQAVTEEKVVVIKIPKAKLAKLRRRLVPVLLVLSLGLNCFFIHAYLRGGMNRGFIKANVGVFQQQAVSGFDRNGVVPNNGAMPSRGANKTEKSDSGVTDDKAASRTPSMNRQNSGSTPSFKR